MISYNGEEVVRLENKHLEKQAPINSTIVHLDNNEKNSLNFYHMA